MMWHEPRSQDARLAAWMHDGRVSHGRGFHLKIIQVRSLSNEFTLRPGQLALVTQYTATLGDDRLGK